MLRAGTVPGLVRVTAGSGGIERALDLAISVGPAAAISLYPADADLASWEQTTIHVTVKDAYNNPVKDGTRVQFEVDEGLIRGDGGAAVPFDPMAFSSLNSLEEVQRKAPAAEGLITKAQVDAARKEFGTEFQAARRAA